MRRAIGILARLAAVALVCASLAEASNTLQSSSVGAHIHDQRTTGGVVPAEVSGPGATTENVVAEGATEGVRLEGGSHQIVRQILDETGACLWSQITQAPNSLQQCGNEFRSEFVLKDIGGVTSKTFRSLSDVFDDGMTAVTVAVDPTGGTMDLNNLRVVNLRDAANETDATNLETLRAFVGANPAPAVHRGVACVGGGNGGQVCATSGEDILRLVAGSANVSVTCSIVTGQKVCRISVQQGIPSTFALYSDPYYCLADYTSCGSITSPCCSVTDMARRMQLNNDNGGATCTLDKSLGCMTCSSSGTQCNEGRDCAGNTCSTSATTRCDKNGDCPAGEWCNITEACVADDTVCSALSKGTCAGNIKSYGLYAGAGTSVERLTPDLFSPGSVALIGKGRGVTAISSRNAPPGLFNTEMVLGGPYEPENCILSLYGLSSMEIRDLNLDGVFTAGLCLFGDVRGLRTEGMGSAIASSTGLPIYTGERANTSIANWHGRNIGTTTFLDNTIWGFFGQGNMLFTIASPACTNSLSTSCSVDSDCPAGGTCTVAGNGDLRVTMPNTVNQGGNIGGTAIAFRSVACGSAFNIDVDNVFLQFNASSAAGLPSKGIRMYTESCGGPGDPSVNPVTGVRPMIRVRNVNLGGNDAVPYSEPDVSLQLEDYAQVLVRGPFTYDPCRRHIGENARIYYSYLPAIGPRQTGGNSDLGSILCDAPNDPQEGEKWCVDPTSGTTHAGQCAHFINGAVEWELYGASYDDSTGNLAFKGDVTDTLNLNVNGKTALRARGHGSAGFSYDFTVQEDTPLTVSRWGYGINWDHRNQNARTQGRGAWGWLVSPNQSLSKHYFVPIASTFTPGPTFTPTPSFTPTATRTPTATNGSPTLTFTPTFTPTNTRTVTPTSDGSTNTPTRTGTITKTPTLTATGTRTLTPTQTLTPTRPPEGTPDIASYTDQWTFRDFSVADTSKDQPNTQSTPGAVIRCQYPTPCQAVDCTQDGDVANQRCVKTLIPTPVPTFTPTSTFTITPTFTPTATFTLIPTPTAPRLLDARDAVAANPVLGDVIYANSTPAWTKLAGTTSGNPAYLTQTGTGSVSAAPSWSETITLANTKSITFKDTGGTATCGLRNDLSNVCSLKGGSGDSVQLEDSASGTIATFYKGPRAQFSGTAPSIASCGTGASIVGTNVAGKVTIGTGGSTACAVTFNTPAWSNAPICLAQNETSSARVPRPTTTTTVLTLNDTLNASDVIAYHCLGRE